MIKIDEKLPVRNVLILQCTENLTGVTVMFSIQNLTFQDSYNSDYTLNDVITTFLIYSILQTTHWRSTVEEIWFTTLKPTNKPA
jgi:hypothetical protein